MLHAVEHVLDTDDVQVRLLLAGERCVGQVFRGSGRTHGERQLARRAVLQDVELLTDFLLETCLQRRIDDPLADFGAGFGERLHVVDVERLETLGDAVGKVVVLEEIAERERGRGETGGYANACFGKLADHFAQRRILAADDLHIGHPQLLERNYIRLVLCDVCCVSHTSP